MSFVSSKFFPFLAGAIITASAAAPASLDVFSETAKAAAPAEPLSLATADDARDALLHPASQAPLPAAETPAAKTDASAPHADAALDPELECMAKVVHHEAGNQPRDGKLAVAQLIRHRVESGRFASTVCGVVNQPGQFFATAAYHPHPGAGWDEAVDVSREAIAGSTPEVAPGALFYHAAYQAAPRFFRSRPRVMTLGDHIFYR